MSSLAVRLTKQQTLAFVPHSSASGDTWSYTKSGTCTSAGASNGTTLIDTNGDSAAADTYNGAYWVRIKSGALTGAWKRIVDDDGSGTLTFEGNGFEAQVASGVEYEIFKSPDPVAVVTTSTSTTAFTASARTEATSSWVGYWLCVVYGGGNGGTSPSRGEMKQITASTSGGVLTTAAWSNQPRVGDVLVIRQFIEPSQPSDGTTEGYEARRSERVNFGMGDGVVTQRGGTFGFDTDFTASGALSASGSRAGLSAIGGLIPACGFAETVQTSATVGAGSTTTAITVATASWENFAVGAPVVWNGHLRWVTALTDGGAGVDTVTVTPALPTAPAASDVLYAGRLYARSTTGDTLGVLLEHEVDGVRTTLTGCKGNVTLNDGAKLALAWQFSVDHWIEEVEAAPYSPGSAYTTAKPLLTSDRHVYIDTTATDVGGITASLNATHAPKNMQGSAGVNGRAGYHLTDQAPGCTFRELLTSSGDGLAQQLRFTARTAFAFATHWGTHGNSAGFRIPVGRLRERAKRTDDGGLQAIPEVVAAQDAGNTVDGASATVKVPDFAIGIM